MYLTKFSISSSLKGVFAIAIVAALAACGFHPLYENHERQGNRMCENFTVQKITNFDVSGQKLQYRLQDALNQACINKDKNYKVVVDVVKTKEGIGIQKDREITRYNIYYTGTFTVIDQETSKSAYHGSSTMVGGYDAQVSDFGTYALEGDTERKLLEEMANDIALKVSSSLLRHKDK